MDISVKQVFTDNQEACMKITDSIPQIISKLIECKEPIPKYLEVLIAIGKVQKHNMIIKRNLKYIMEEIMAHYTSVMGIVKKEKDFGYIRYYVYLIIYSYSKQIN